MNSKSIQMLAIVTAVVMVSAVVGFAASQIAEALDNTPVQTVAVQTVEVQTVE